MYKQISADQRSGAGGPVWPLPVAIGLALPLLFMSYFYLSYAQHGWFWQDDFGFIVHYQGSVRSEELISFDNFGRFVSRNLYWHYGLHYFSSNAAFFYLFNFFTIAGTCLLLYRLFSAQYRHFSGIAAALSYFCLPATISAYSWLSNSQHLSGHFFVILFVYLYVCMPVQSGPRTAAVRTAALLLVLTAGFAANIFVSMVLSLPLWMMLVDRQRRRLKADWILIACGLLLFGWYFSKLRGSQTGAYATAYTLEVLQENLQFYFSSMRNVWLWLFCTGTGVLYSWLRRRYLTGWLLLASVIFFLPFAFFKYQRYEQYAALTYLFFILGSWAWLNDLLSASRPRWLQYIATCLILGLFVRALEPELRFFSLNPRGAAQKRQIEFLRDYDASHPELRHYCFRSDKQVINASGIAEWDIPGEWWSVGFGDAYRHFVNHEKSFELQQNARSCDVVFVFQRERLSLQSLQP